MIDPNIQTPQEVVDGINKRIKEIEQMIANEQRDFLYYTQKYNKSFKMRYATKALNATNKIKKHERKIELYKEVRLKYE